MIHPTAPLAAFTALVFAAVPLLPAAAQDAAAGQRVFNQCRSCHTVEQGGRSAVGQGRFVLRQGGAPR